MNHDLPTAVLHWNYRGFTEFPIKELEGEESEVTDIYLKENLLTQVPNEVARLVHLESLYLSGNDITELPVEISELRYLKCLDVSGNRLQKIPEEIGDMISLKFLILDENELTELPLRIAEIRSLRYFSVCDNKLRWLPQKPVYNNYHCELRFWRNTSLKSMPYSLWYHMFRDQQTRSLNIGCLSIHQHLEKCQATKGRLRINEDSRVWDYNVDFPYHHENILDKNNYSPPSLFELCKRVFYKALCKAAETKSKEPSTYPIQSKENCYNNNKENVEENFKGINIGYEMHCDVNGNNMNLLKKDLYYINGSNRNKQYYTTKDIVEEYFSFLPSFIKRDLRNGPVTRCENVSCKDPVFDYAFYEFCLGKIILIDDSEEIVLSAAFCSKSCLNSWIVGKTNILSLKLEND